MEVSHNVAEAVTSVANCLDVGDQNMTIENRHVGSVVRLMPWPLPSQRSRPLGFQPLLTKIPRCLVLVVLGRLQRALTCVSC